MVDRHLNLLHICVEVVDHVTLQKLNTVVGYLELIHGVYMGLLDLDRVFLLFSIVPSGLCRQGTSPYQWFSGTTDASP